MLYDFASVGEQLKKHGVGFGTDLVLKSNLKRHVREEIFRDYIGTVFSSTLTEFHVLDKFTEEMAV
jgi:hypothetical protein